MPGDGAQDHRQAHQRRAPTITHGGLESSSERPIGSSPMRCNASQARRRRRAGEHQPGAAQGGAARGALGVGSSDGSRRRARLGSRRRRQAELARPARGRRPRARQRDRVLVGVEHLVGDLRPGVALARDSAAAAPSSRRRAGSSGEVDAASRPARWRRRAARAGRRRPCVTTSR